VFTGPGSQYSPECTGMYMDGQQMMRAAGKFSDISFEIVGDSLNLIGLETVKSKLFFVFFSGLHMGRFSLKVNDVIRGY